MLPESVHLARGANPKVDYSDFKAFGIFVKNSGKRFLEGYEFHNLTVEKIYILYE